MNNVSSSDPVPTGSVSTASMPPGFVWGAATAAYQIEGAWDADGKGPSVWDAFCDSPGRVHEGHHGRIACDHYHRHAEDVACMRAIGLQAYRFSISWPRVIPAGTGAVAAAGLDFYDRLVDRLLEAGIQPWATLFHWDYPLALYAQGGWLHPSSPDWFAEYAGLVTARLSDRVRHWMTLNEPQSFVALGHHEPSIHAPGDKMSLTAALRAGHHVLLAHGKAVQSMRAAAVRTIEIGWAPVGVVAMPETESAADVEAAREVMFSTGMTSWSPLWNNVWWADPVLRGTYPEDGLRLFGAQAPHFTDAEMRTIATPIDFYGCNIYNGQTYRAGPDGRPQKVDHPPGYPQALNGWKLTPGSLYWGPRFLHERYRLPLVVTENGVSCHDWPSIDGAVHDAQRTDFLHRYLRELRRATSSGVDVRGYFVWSLLDNFEWAEGYRQRFGIIHVDFATQQRTLKDSALWYKNIIRTHGAAL